MKAILEFNLPEEQSEYRVANEAADWRAALVDSLEKLRYKLKYEEPPHCTAQAYEEVRQILLDEIHGRGLNLDGGL